MGSAPRYSVYVALLLVGILVPQGASASWDPLFRGAALFDAGEWSTTAAYRTGSANQVALGDLNGDGRPDLVAVNQNDSLPPQWGNTISVLLHSADPSAVSPFLPKANYGTISQPASIELADMNLDGNLDAVVRSTGNAHPEPDSVCVMLGNGSGSFGAPISAAQLTLRNLQGGGKGLLLEDVNQDGWIDVLAHGRSDDSEAMLGIMHGVGGGALAPPVLYDAAPNTSIDEPYGFALGDLTGDGIADVALAGYPFGIAILQGDGTGAFTFSTAIPTPAGYALDVAITNLDADAIRDVVFVDPDGVGVLIGAGSGNFSAPVSYPQTFRADYLEIGDLDLDGKADVITAGYSPQFSVWRGNGDGTLGPVTYQVSPHPSCGDFRLADVNLNGRLDLVSANGGSWGDRDHTVPILFDDEAAGFRTGRLSECFLPGAQAHDPALADFDRNGKLDVAVAESDLIEVALGQGDGTYIGMVAGSAFTPGVIVTGDWNRDGRDDLAYQSSGVSISAWMGDGTGGFTTSGFVIPNRTLHRRSVADMNRDGRPDLVVTSNQQIMIETQSADGTYFENAFQGTSGTILSFVLGDWNRDGITDVVVTTSSTQNGTQLLLGNGDGTLGTAQLVRNRSYADLCAGDFNRDGKLDLAMLYGKAGQSGLFGIDVSLGNGAGGFLVGPAIPTTLEQNGYRIESWDVNVDGYPDLVCSGMHDPPFDFLSSDTRTSSVEVHLGNGAGQFGPPIAYSLGLLTSGLSPSTPRFVVGDVNRDDQPDVLSVAEKSAHVLLATPPDFGNALGPRVDYAMDAGTSRVALGDLNRDGILDVVTSSMSSLVTVRLGSLQGTLGAATTVPQSLAALEVDLADVNRDGKLDLLFVGTNELVACMLGNGDGTFGPRIDHTTTVGVFDLAVGDMNRDGRPDLVIGRYEPGVRYLRILLGNGDGTFTADPVQIAIPGPWIYDIEIVDAGRDGVSDVVLAAGQMRVLIGNGAGGFIGGYAVDAGTTLQRVCSADFDHDGFMDVAASDLDGAVKVAWGSATPPFSAYVSSATPGSAWDLQAGQAERDGRWFLYLSTQGWNKVELMQPGVTPGSYVTAGSYDSGIDPVGLALGDLNRDGLLDVFTANSSDGTVSVFSGPSTLVTGVATTSAPSARARLDQNVPNPFNPETTIRFAVPEAGPVELSVYDVQGRVVSKLIDGPLPIGEHAVRWNGRLASGSPAASGVYYYRLRTAQDEKSRRMVLVK